MQKPSIPKGTRDFGPENMFKRSFILDNIRAVFQKFGFLPLETPAMENLNVLMGKYGEEGDRLLFKILNSGDFMNSVSPEDHDGGSSSVWPKITKKGLRYDLTVPFARYVVMNQNEITFPFKRYQIQPVWRGDRPQKGRYQEFFQCDADVIGTQSLTCEAEIVMMIKEVFDRLKIEDYTIRINHRKLLTAIAEYIGAEGKENDLFVAIDKLDKIGLEKVNEELSGKGFQASSIEKLNGILGISGTIDEVLDKLEPVKALDSGNTAVADIKEIQSYLSGDEYPVALDVTLARGLSYYTGTIFEVTLNDKSMGSLSGGGRYDDLTGVFGLKDMSGIGFSLGVDRIFDVMETRKLFPENALKSTELLLVCLGNEEKKHGMELAIQARRSNIKTELYPDTAKLKKQMTYANKKSIPWVLIIGEEELSSKAYTLKNMESGEQQSLSFPDVIAQIASK